MAAKRPTRWPALLAAGLMMPASIVPVAWLELEPRNDSDVAVVFAPWTTSEEALARVVAAEGLPVRMGFAAPILVAHSDAPGFPERLYRAGAWAVVDPVAFGGCIIESGSKAS